MRLIIFLRPTSCEKIADGIQCILLWPMRIAQIENHRRYGKQKGITFTQTGLPTHDDREKPFRRRFWCAWAFPGKIQATDRCQNSLPRISCLRYTKIFLKESLESKLITSMPFRASFESTREDFTKEDVNENVRKLIYKRCVASILQDEDVQAFDNWIAATLSKAPINQQRFFICAQMMVFVRSYMIEPAK